MVRCCGLGRRGLDYRPMTILGMLLASIGAGLILTALTFVTILIGILVNAMVALFAGPLLDRVLGEEPEAPAAG